MFGMDFIIFVSLVGAGYALQCGICRWKKGLFLRLLPGMITLAAAVCCAFPVIAIPYWEDLIAFIGVFFLAFGLGALWLGSLIAWIVYAVGRIVQKRSK